MLKDLAVIDRQFKGKDVEYTYFVQILNQYTGEIAATMDKLTTRALQAQVEAAVS